MHPRSSHRFSPSLAAAVLVLMISAALAVGCASTPVNSDPRCLPCPKYFANADTGLCPFEPFDRPFDGPYTNLVFEGGGVKGTAYGGSLAVLEGSGRLRAIDQVAGTSAGALTAVLVALGYSAEEIHEIVLAIDFKRFRDGSVPGDVVRLIDDFGWYKGDYALCLLECLVHEKTDDKKTTFAQLHEMRDDRPEIRDLFIFGTDVNRQSSVEFSYLKNGDVPIADAARISMSIPFFFAARVLGGDTFVDGGVLRNYPITVFDANDPLDATLGFHLGSDPDRTGFDNVLDFAGGVFETLLDQQIAQLCDTMPESVERSVFIDTLGISTTDFSITPKQKCDLIRSGRDATVRYLEASEHPQQCPEWLLPLEPAHGSPGAR